MKKLVSIMMVAVSLALAGCGGSSSTCGTLIGEASCSNGSNTTTISVLASVPQMPSDGSTTVTITALVKDANNNVVSAAPVTFQASSGALTINQTTTGSDGTATATLGTGGDPTNRGIRVTATSGSSNAAVTVNVVGTKLSLSGPTSLVQGDTGNYTAALTDSGGTGISSQSVDITSAKDNTISATPVTTDSTGKANFTVTAANSGTDTLTAAALGMQATESVSVSSNSFTFNSPTANQSVDIGTTATVTVVWTNSGTPVAGQTVNFSATRGTLSASSATTNAQGQATVTISASTSGPSVIAATGNGVSAQVAINFLATTPSAIDLQASPTTIPTQGQSTLTAIVRDANGNLVQGQTVDFAITQDSTGGSLSAASAVTNAQGQASTSYTASTTTSAANGVKISATVQGTSVTGSTSLTVGGQTVFLSLGTGNTLVALSSTQYELPYSVQAVDAAGNAVKGVTVTFSVASLGYVKGNRQWNYYGDNLWDTVPSTSASDAEAYVLDGVDGCVTEDANNDGIEDNNYNNDTNTIWPGLVVSTDVTSATTDSNGSASVNLIYPKDHAYYVAVKLTASATVQGTQSSTSATFWLPGLTTEFNNQQNAPPGPNSPYGGATSCASAQ